MFEYHIHIFTLQKPTWFIFKSIASDFPFDSFRKDSYQGLSNSVISLNVTDKYGKVIDRRYYEPLYFSFANLSNVLY